MRGSSPKIVLVGVKTENRSFKWPVFMRKFFVWEDVARAMCTGEDVDVVDARVERRVCTPGKGWEVGKWISCRADCLVR